VRGKVLAAVRSEQLISIDGTPAPFLTLTAATGHAAASTKRSTCHGGALRERPDAIEQF
jgi:hypothetical protein